MNEYWLLRSYKPVKYSFKERIGMPMRSRVQKLHGFEDPYSLEDLKRIVTYSEPILSNGCFNLEMESNFHQDSDYLSIEVIFDRLSKNRFRHTVSYFDYGMKFDCKNWFAELPWSFGGLREHFLSKAPDLELRLFDDLPDTLILKTGKNSLSVSYQSHNFVINIPGQSMAKVFVETSTQDELVENYFLETFVSGDDDLDKQSLHKRLRILLENMCQEEKSQELYRKLYKSRVFFAEEMYPLVTSLSHSMYIIWLSKHVFPHLRTWIVGMSENTKKHKEVKDKLTHVIYFLQAAADYLDNSYEIPADILSSQFRMPHLSDYLLELSKWKPSTEAIKRIFEEISQKHAKLVIERAKKPLNAAIIQKFKSLHYLDLEGYLRKLADLLDVNQKATKFRIFPVATGREIPGTESEPLALLTLKETDVICTKNFIEWRRSGKSSFFYFDNRGLPNFDTALVVADKVIFARHQKLDNGDDEFVLCLIDLSPLSTSNFTRKQTDPIVVAVKQQKIDKCACNRVINFKLSASKEILAVFCYFRHTKAFCRRYDKDHPYFTFYKINELSDNMFLASKQMRLKVCFEDIEGIYGSSALEGKEFDEKCSSTCNNFFHVNESNILLVYSRVAKGKKLRELSVMVLSPNFDSTPKTFKLVQKITKELVYSENSQLFARIIDTSAKEGFSSTYRDIKEPSQDRYAWVAPVNLPPPNTPILMMFAQYLQSYHRLTVHIFYYQSSKIYKHKSYTGSEKLLTVESTYGPLLFYDYCPCTRSLCSGVGYTPDLSKMIRAEEEVEGMGNRDYTELVFREANVKIHILQFL